jgi:hypothetical protein
VVNLRGGRYVARMGETILSNNGPHGMCRGRPHRQGQGPRNRSPFPGRAARRVAGRPVEFPLVRRPAPYPPSWGHIVHHVDELVPPSDTSLVAPWRGKRGITSRSRAITPVPGKPATAPGKTRSSSSGRWSDDRWGAAPDRGWRYRRRAWSHKTAGTAHPIPSRRTPPAPG